MRKKFGMWACLGASAITLAVLLALADPRVMLALPILCIAYAGGGWAERRAAAAARSTRGFTHLFESSPVAKAMSGLSDGIVISANKAYLDLFGLSASQILGKRPSEAGVITEPGLREEMFARLRDGRPVAGEEARVQTPRGPRELMVWSLATELDGRMVAMTTFIDVTDRNRAQREARATEARMREVVENVQEVTWLTNPANSEMLYISPAYEKVFGRSAAALYADARDWLQSVHPDDRERCSRLIPLDGCERLDDHYRLLRENGDIREIDVSLFPVRDDAGAVVRIAGVAVDVTDRRLLEEQERQTQKLESLGLLAGGVAHDFNNVLAVINANIGLLSESIAPGGLEHELVQEVEAAVGRACGLTRQLLAFSRKQVAEPVVLDLNEAVKDTRKMLRRMLGDDITITTSLDADLRHVTIDPGCLVQVLLNLAVNARDAMPRGGTFALTTRNLASGQVMLEIADTGTGIPPEVRGRVFEPFFTTKEVGKGTGLGLSVVHGIVEQAGGRIDLDSELGTGTVFRIFLPGCDQPAHAVSDVSRLAPAGVERILLVDDDPFVRASSARALRARGYTVVEARDGHDAMLRLREHGELALLITDVMMPGMDGGELATVARVERPDLKILLTSGYTDDALLDHGIKPTGIGFLEKPYGAHALAGRVRQIIDTVHTATTADAGGHPRSATARTSRRSSLHPRIG